MNKIIITAYLATSCLCLAQDIADWFSLSEQDISTIEASRDTYKTNVETSLESSQWVLNTTYLQAAIDAYNSLPRAESDALALVREIPANYTDENPLPTIVVAYEKSFDSQNVENYLRLRDLIGYMNPDQMGSFLATISTKGTPQVIDLIIGSGVEELFRERVGNDVDIADLSNWATSNTWNNPLYRKLGLEYITPKFTENVDKFTFLDPYLSETDPTILDALIEQYVALDNAEAKTKLQTVAQNATNLGHTEIADKATNAVNNID